MRRPISDGGRAMMDGVTVGVTLELGLPDRVGFFWIEREA
jgi:hypothetical protein